MRAVAPLLIGLLCASCAPMGMMPVPGGGRTTSRDPAATVEEVVVGGVRAVVTIPPLAVGRETTLTLSLSNAGTARPLPAAEVRLRAWGTDRDDPPAESLVRETATPGAYSAPFVPAGPGRVAFEFRVVVSGVRTLEPAPGADAGAIVVGPFSAAAAHPHGRPRTVPRAMIGGALMAAMMLAMIVARGGMR